MSPGGVEYGGLRCSDTADTLLSVKEVAMIPVLGRRSRQFGPSQSTRTVRCGNRGENDRCGVRRCGRQGRGKLGATLTDPDALDAIVNRSARGGHMH